MILYSKSDFTLNTDDYKRQIMFFTLNHMQNNDTAMHCAAQEGHLATIKELVEAGATQLKNKVSVHLMYMYTTVLP